MRLLGAVVEPMASGEFRVTLDVAAQQVRADRIGNATTALMDAVGAAPVGAGMSTGLPNHRLFQLEIDDTIQRLAPMSGRTSIIDQTRDRLPRRDRAFALLYRRWKGWYGVTRLLRPVLST
jgi:hypothetical protein